MFEPVTSIKGNCDQLVIFPKTPITIYKPLKGRVAYSQNLWLPVAVTVIRGLCGRGWPRLKGKARDEPVNRKVPFTQDQANILISQ